MIEHSIARSPGTRNPNSSDPLMRLGDTLAEAAQELIHNLDVDDPGFERILDRAVEEVARYAMEVCSPDSWYADTARDYPHLAAQVSQLRRNAGELFRDLRGLRNSTGRLPASALQQVLDEMLERHESMKRNELNLCLDQMVDVSALD